MHSTMPNLSLVNSCIPPESPPKRSDAWTAAIATHPRAGVPKAAVHAGLETSTRIARPHLCPDSIARQVEAALTATGYPLNGIRCHCDGDRVVLMGHATCYFHVQVALTLALQIADWRRVICEIEVRKARGSDPN